MRDPKRIEPLLARLAQVWHQYPDWRLSQLIVNTCRDRGIDDPFYIEDEAFVKLFEDAWSNPEEEPNKGA